MSASLARNPRDARRSQPFLAVRLSPEWGRYVVSEAPHGSITGTARPDRLLPREREVLFV